MSFHGIAFLWPDIILILRYDLCYKLGSASTMSHRLIFNSLRPNDAYMHQQTRSSLLQIMACCLYSTEPLSEPMLDYCWLDPWEQVSGKMKSKFKRFHWRKQFKDVVCKMAAFCLGLNVFTQIMLQNSHHGPIIYKFITLQKLTKGCRTNPMDCMKLTSWLTHCGLVMLNGITDLSKHWLT